MEHQEQITDPSAQAAMSQEGETAVIRGTANQDARLLVSDQRLVVREGDRLALDIPFNRLRRIQFDIERHMPATLVIVPDRPSDAPQVLFVPPEEYPVVAQAVVTIGRRLQQVSEAES